jgi:hypothetical protein
LAFERIMRDRKVSHTFSGKIECVSTLTTHLLCSSKQDSFWEKLAFYTNDSNQPFWLWWMFYQVLWMWNSWVDKSGLMQSVIFLSSLKTSQKDKNDYVFPHNVNENGSQEIFRGCSTKMEELISLDHSNDNLTFTT